MKQSSLNEFSLSLYLGNSTCYIHIGQRDTESCLQKKMHPKSGFQRPSHIRKAKNDEHRGVAEGLRMAVFQNSVSCYIKSKL